MMMKWFLVALVALFFSNCQRIEVRNEIRQVKQLRFQLDSIRQVYMNIDKKSYKKIEKEIYATFDVIKNRDTNVYLADSSYMKYFAPWADAGKGINRMFRKKIPGIENELKLTKQQLKNLRHDIAKELIPADSVEIYIAQEKKAITNLIKDITLVESEFNRCAGIYEKKKSEVTGYLKSISSKSE